MSMGLPRTRLFLTSIPLPRVADRTKVADPFADYFGLATAETVSGRRVDHCDVMAVSSAASGFENAQFFFNFGSLKRSNFFSSLQENSGGADNRMIRSLRRQRRAIF
jgi:hypothetical protein